MPRFNDWAARRHPDERFTVELDPHQLTHWR
jgi:hypothetical protein